MKNISTIMMCAMVLVLTSVNNHLSAQITLPPPVPPLFWGLEGNSGTVDGTHFIGTTDNIPFSIRVNNQKAGRIDAVKANTYLGYRSGNGGSNNTGIGHSALFSTTSGSFNTCVGDSALAHNTTGETNAAFGTYSMVGNTTGSNNTGCGHFTLPSNIDGVQNTAVGSGSMRQNISGSFNTAAGHYSLYGNSTGDTNTCSGYYAMFFNTTGYGNSAFGGQALMNSTTGNYNTALGFQADVSVNPVSNATAIGYGAKVNASNKIRLGNAAVTVVEGPVVYTTSDGRFKTSIKEEDVKGLEFIKRLRPVAYNFDTRKFQEFLTKGTADGKGNELKNIDFSKSTAIRQTGFIAQEMEKAMKETGYNFNGLHAPENENDNYSISYALLTVPLVKAVQELSKQNEETLKLVEELKTELAELKAKSAAGSNVRSVELGSATSIILNQNEPNPFAEQTSISYNIPADVKQAQILFYDMTGKVIKSFDLTEKGAGVLQVYASNLSNGTYTYSIIADGKVIATKTMMKTN